MKKDEIDAVVEFIVENIQPWRSSYQTILTSLRLSGASIIAEIFSDRDIRVLFASKIVQKTHRAFVASNLDPEKIVGPLIERLEAMVVED